MALPGWAAALPTQGRKTDHSCSSMIPAVNLISLNFYCRWNFTLPGLMRAGSNVSILFVAITT